MKQVSRRNVLASAGAATMGLAAAESSGTAQAAAGPLTFDTPADHIRAFLKLHLSLASETIYHTYTGTLEAMVPGREIVNLVACTTLLRRQIEEREDGHHVTVWEGTVYHRPGETEPLDEFVNPLNGRTVRPFHQREGRGQALWTATGPKIRRSNGEWVTLGGGKPYTFDWYQAGGRIWMSRYSSGVYAQNPLNSEEWPLEFSGPDLIYSEKTTNSGLVSEMADPSILNASATYGLNVTMPWWPWLLMGRTPGHLVWNTEGVKMSSPDELPPDVRAMIERLHPRLFADDEPWSERYNLWTDYPKMRTPVAG